MTEVPQNPDLAKAFDVADKLAALEGTQYPDEFLVDLHKTDLPLFQEFSQIKDLTASQPETVALLAELDGMLQDFELREKTKDSVAFKEEMQGLGLTDELLSKFYVALSTNPERYGEPYANTALIPSGYSPSYSTDKEIAQMISGRYKKVEDLVGAYQELELHPSQNNEARIIRESVDFLRAKAPAFIALRTQSRMERETKAKEAAQAASEKTAHEKAVDGYLGVYADTSTEDFVAQTEPLLREFVDYGNAAQGVDFSQQLKTAQVELEAASTDEARVEADSKIREICAAILVEDDRLKAASTPPLAPAVEEAEVAAQAPAAAPKARRRPTGAVVITSGPHEEAAEVAEEPVDYRAEAKANPDQYKSEKTGDAGKGSFKFDTHDNLDADLAIRVEDLMGDQHDLILTSPRFGALEFKYNPDGVDGKGASWYAGKQRLIIRSGDTISYKKPEAPAVAVAEVAPAAVVVAPGGAAPEVPAAPVEVVDEAAAKKTAYDLAKVVSVLEVSAERQVKDLTVNHKTRESAPDEWATLDKTYANIRQVVARKDFNLDLAKAYATTDEDKRLVDRVVAFVPTIEASALALNVPTPSRPAPDAGATAVVQNEPVAPVGSGITDASDTGTEEESEGVNGGGAA